MSTPLKIRNPWPGSKVGVIAPANSMVDLDPRLVEFGTKRLQESGFDVRLAPRINAGLSQSPASIEDRMYDIRNMLDDPTVSILMPVFGGYNSIDLLPYLPYEQFSDRRVGVIGFSDTTALLNAITKMTGLITLHGPSFASFCEPQIHPYTLASFSRAMGFIDAVHTDPHTSAEDFWYEKPDFGPREFQPNTWKAFRPGTTSGRLVGGNTSTLLALAGTRFFPTTRDSILMLEDSIDTPPGMVDRNLAQLDQMGVLDEISGLIVGKPGRRAAPNMLAILQKHCGRLSIPVLYDVNCAHVDPLATLPIGAEISLDTRHATISHSLVVEA